MAMPHYLPLLYEQNMDETIIIVHETNKMKQASALADQDLFPSTLFCYSMKCECGFKKRNMTRFSAIIALIN